MISLVLYSPSMKSESLFVEVEGGNRLHMKRWVKDEAGEAVFLVHGAIENGRIFYSENGKGFAPFLAENGYDVYVADLRGRGKSEPRISRESTFGNWECINVDVPAMLERIREIKGTKVVWLGSHSWGGNILLPWFSKYSDTANVKGIINFATRRRVTKRSMEWLYKLGFGWGVLGRYSLWKYGYLNAVGMKMGGDNESRKTLEEINVWINTEEWIDQVDGTNYGEKLRSMEKPPILSITGGGDHLLGNVKDVKMTLDEIHPQDGEFKIIGKKTGFKNDYDHINLLTHKQAVQDHFVMILDWMKSKS